MLRVGAEEFAWMRVEKGDRESHGGSGGVGCLEGAQTELQEQ